MRFFRYKRTGRCCKCVRINHPGAAESTGASGGFSVIELLIALTMMALLGGSLLTLISTGSNVFQRVFDEKDAQSEARIALSYVTVKLRQNGTPGTVSLVDSGSPDNRRNVLKIDRTPDVESDDCYFIYFDEGGGEDFNGQLREKNSNTPGTENSDDTFIIANIRDCNFSYFNEEKTQIKISVSYGKNDVQREMSAVITLRA